MAAASSTLAENVAAALRHAILNGAYLCGDRLVELTIAHELNVSQNTVRDALRLLEQDGLVVKHARRGTYVRTYTPGEALEIYALWAALESLALRWVIERLQSDHMDILREQFRRFLEQSDLENRFQFHAALVDLADKPRTAELLRSLHHQARLLENLNSERRHSLDLTAYQILYDAVAARDTALAETTLRNLLELQGAAAAQRVAYINRD